MFHLLHLMNVIHCQGVLLVVPFSQPTLPVEWSMLVWFHLIELKGVRLHQSCSHCLNIKRILSIQLLPVYWYKLSFDEHMHLNFLICAFQFSELVLRCIRFLQILYFALLMFKLFQQLHLLFCECSIIDGFQQDGNIEDPLYDQLEQAVSEAVNLRREAFEAAVRRAKAERDAIEAIRRVYQSLNALFCSSPFTPPLFSLCSLGLKGRLICYNQGTSNES